MFPLKDNIPSRKFPYINYALILINFLVFFYELSLGKYLQLFIANYGFVPLRFTVGLEQNLPLLKLVIPAFTSMFLHGGWFHIIGNMWFLYIFGDNVEDRLGHFHYLLFYLTSGLIAVLFQYILAPYSRVPMIGASGAIAGVLGAYMIFYPYAKVLTLLIIFIFIEVIYIPAFLYLFLWFFIQFIYGTSSAMLASTAGGGVAWWAHIGGFLFGVIWGLIMKPFHRDERDFLHEILPW